MRDILVTLIVFGGLLFTFSRPYIGVLIWNWISLMNPHRLGWGFAYSFPFAQIIGIVTLFALLFSRERKSFPVTSATVVLVLFVIWETVTSFFAINQESVWWSWSRSMKIQAMILITLVLVNNREKLIYLVWTIVVSLGFYGIKGGIFSATGGSGLVWGPPGSFIGGNNELALALVMTIPLMWYLQGQYHRLWVRMGLWGAMGLTTIAVIGSYSRGALLAIVTMAAFMWLKSSKKMLLGMLIAVTLVASLPFIPEKWYERMSTIETYKEDQSANGRLNAWAFAFNLAKARPFVGGGFDTFTPELFFEYAPDPLDYHDAHSIYFQVLGEHGFVGLILFLTLLALSWRDGSYILKHCQRAASLKWARDLAAMIQVSMVGYIVGGAFLGLAYFDLPYLLIAILVLTRVIVVQELNLGSGRHAPSSSAARMVRTRREREAPT